MSEKNERSTRYNQSSVNQNSQVDEFVLKTQLEIEFKIRVEMWQVCAFTLKKKEQILKSIEDMSYGSSGG